MPCNKPKKKNQNIMTSGGPLDAVKMRSTDWYNEYRKFWNQIQADKEKKKGGKY